MSAERAERLRRWHERAYLELRAGVPTRMSFMGLDLRIDEDVFAPQGDAIGDAFHQAVAGEVRPGDRVLDMGTGSGVSGILAARAGATVVAVDVNPRAVACARANAARNGVADRMTVLEGDVFGPVEGDFDLIVFDPELSDREGYRWDARLHGQATRDGWTAQYYVIRLTA